MRLHFEDVDLYTEQLVRAAESVVSPLGWDRSRIRQYLREWRDGSLGAFNQ